MTALSACGLIVRRHDPDRFFCTLFAPPEHREALFVLYAFNHELARAREVVREPYAALIRLQWWREVVEGARRRHEVAGPLGAALDAGWLDARILEGMVDAREAEADTIDTLADFESYTRGTAGGVMVAAAAALGMMDAETLRGWGAAYGVMGMVRSVNALARQGRCLLPGHLLASHGLSGPAIAANPAADGMVSVRRHLAGLAKTWLDQPVSVPRSARSASLPAILARRDVRRGGAVGPRPFLDKLALGWAGFVQSAGP